jgi:hypothetical protein
LAIKDFKEWNLYLDAATSAQVCSGYEILASIAFHHGLLGKCLHDSMSQPGNTWYHLDEDSEQPRNQLKTDFMAAHIPHSLAVPLSPGFYFHTPNPLPYNQQSVIVADLSALLYKHSPQDLLLFDPFWVGPKRLSGLIPPDFPLHIDSIRAESFSRDMTSSHQGNLIDMLDIFRKKIISAHGGNRKQVPSTFSITRASNSDIPTQFGVTAPVKKKTKNRSRLQMTDLVRRYRVLQCWGEQQPPLKSEEWEHGQCAEDQSLSSVVAQCADLGLKNVIIDTLAMKKSGRLVGMCKNCRSYVSHRILRKHPTWKVVDYTTRISS